MTIEILSHQQHAVAAQIHTLLMLAHAQEAALLGLKNFVPSEQTTADIQASEEFFLGCCDGPTLLGVISVCPDDEPGTIHIAKLAVHAAHQRAGVARALVTNALQRAAGATFSVCTAAKNAPALALYGQFGFTACRWGTMGDEAWDLVKLRRTPPR